MAKLTREEQQRNARRRTRQMLGLVVVALVVVGVVSIVRSGAGIVEKLFDDTEQKAEFEQNLQGLVMFDPLPFEGVENIQDTTLREAAIWGTIYQIFDTADGFTNYERDEVTDQLLLPAVEIDAYLAKIFGPDFKMTHATFESQGMTITFDESKQCYYIPVTGLVGSYTPVVVELVKDSGRLYVTVGYVPMSTSSNFLVAGDATEPTKYMDYVFERSGGEWYLVALEESDMVATPSASSQAVLTEALPPLEEFEATVLEDLSQSQSTDSDAEEDALAEDGEDGELLEGEDADSSEESTDDAA